MDKEFAQLKAILSNTETKHFNHKDFVTGQLGDKEIILQQCGIGKVNSAIGAVEMINHYHPDLVISSGVRVEPTLHWRLLMWWWQWSVLTTMPTVEMR